MATYSWNLIPHKMLRILWNTNHAGIGLLDAMALPSTDAKTGENFPPYYVFNNDHHLPPSKKAEGKEPWPELNAIIYDIKAGSSNDDLVNRLCFRSGVI